MKHKRVGRQWRFDVASKGEVEGIDDDRFRKDRGVNIIR